MQIHQLTIQSRSSRKRIGRGGKRGTYSGRGSKGQKARSGAKIRPLFEGGRSSLIERMKKVRGFKAVHPKKVMIRLSDIDRKYSDGDTVDLASLIERGLLSVKEKRRGAKIIATGELKKKVIIGQDVFLSEGASKKVVSAKGSVVEKKEIERKSEKIAKDI